MNTDGIMRRMALLACFVICLSAASCPPQPGPVETRISILQLNMRGISDVPNGDRNGYWETRFARIGADLGALGGPPPDIIALQEVAGRVWCPDNHNFILDYEPLYKLLRELHAGTSVRYRIANYQPFARNRRVGWTGPTVMGWVIPECYATSGMAVLYNPQRIANLDADASPSVLASSVAFNTDTTTPTLRRSMPCCANNVRPGTEAVCGNIDGPAQSDLCTSASGLAMQVAADMTVSRFSIFGRTDRTFHVYNVHLPWRSLGNYSSATASARAMIDAVENGVPRWFPPVIVGDFNEPADVVQTWASDFSLIDFAPQDNIIQLMAGNGASYRSTADIGRADSQQMPRGVTTGGCLDTGLLWSDHCGLLTTLWIRER